MALWTPAKLDDLFSWWKADAITGLSNNDPVSTWADSHTGGYDVTAATTARPTYNTNVLNSLPVVTYNGSNWLTSGTTNPWIFLHNTTGSTVFTVWKAGTAADPAAAYAPCGNNAINGNNNGYAIYFEDRVAASANESIRGAIVRGIPGTAGSGWTLWNRGADGTHAPNAAKLLSVVSDPNNGTAANRQEIRVDGGTAIKENANANAPSSDNPTYALQVGAAGNNVFPLTGYIAELVICDAILSATNRQKAEGYLAHKWGLAGNLPADHPYKSTAPIDGSPWNYFAQQ